MAKLKLLKEAIDKKKSLAEKLTSRQNLSKDLAKGYVQHNICKFVCLFVYLFWFLLVFKILYFEIISDNIQETTKIGTEVKTPIVRPRTEPVPVVAEDTPKWIQDGKTVERPLDSMKMHHRPDSTKASDKQMADKFKQKFVKHNNKKKWL